MNSTRKRYAATTLAIVLALATVPALSGCSIQNIVKGATGGQVDLGGKAVPKDFPSSVPLAKGDVVYGAAVGDSTGRVWNVTIKVADLATFDAIDSQITGAGFTAESAASTKTEDSATGAYSNDKLGVLVVVTKDGSKGWIANYTVTTKNDK